MLAAAGTITVDGVVHKVVEDVAAVTDQAAVTMTETAHLGASTLPTNMQVIAQVQESFCHLINLWSLTQPPEVIRFALLLAHAIVVTRIRVKQSPRIDLACRARDVGSDPAQGEEGLAGEADSCGRIGAYTRAVGVAA